MKEGDPGAYECFAAWFDSRAKQEPLIKWNIVLYFCSSHQPMSINEFMFKKPC